MNFELKLLLFGIFGNDILPIQKNIKIEAVTMSSDTNPLMKLVEQHGGIVSIKEAREILGAEVYERCWEEIKDLEDWDYFCENGDKVPTHVCTTDWFMDWFCDKVDLALESVGVLSPRTKGLKVH